MDQRIHLADLDSIPNPKILELMLGCMWPTLTNLLRINSRTQNFGTKTWLSLSLLCIRDKSIRFSNDNTIVKEHIINRPHTTFTIKILLTILKKLNSLSITTQKKVLRERVPLILKEKKKKKKKKRSKNSMNPMKLYLRDYLFLSQ